MPFYQPCIIVVLWRYKYGKIGDCKDNDDSEEFRPFLGDVSFYFSISFGFMCDASGSHQQKCASITQEPYTHSPCPQWYLQATITILWLSSWSEQVYRRLREFWKRCETLIKKNNKCNKEKYFKTHYKGSQPSAAGQSADWWPTGFSGSCSSQLPKVCKMVSLATSNITITQWLWNHCALEFVFHSVSSYWWYNMLADGWFDWKINM